MSDEKLADARAELERHAKAFGEPPGRKLRSFLVICGDSRRDTFCGNNMFKLHLSYPPPGSEDVKFIEPGWLITYDNKPIKDNEIRKYNKFFLLYAGDLGLLRLYEGIARRAFRGLCDLVEEIRHDTKCRSLVDILVRAWRPLGDVPIASGFASRAWTVIVHHLLAGTGSE